MARVLILLSALVLMQLQACAQPPTAGATEAMNPVPGKVTDRAGFDRFIESRPTPDQFRARYPDVVLVLPGTVTTKELRTDNSRYFAKLDEQGRIIGGSFR